MVEGNYNRTLQVIDDVCIGCAHCMRVCPTEAIRVSGGKAKIYSDWCVDCGECYRVCPTNAIRVADDDFNHIYRYKYRVLLVPSVFLAQFDKRVPREDLFRIIGQLGFDEVCPVEQSVDSLMDEVNDYVASHKKPVISSYCPAITRLIQVRFPSLVDHILRLLPPLEATAQYYKSIYADKDKDENGLGIFYLTPCVAKIAAVKSPVGGYVSPINGVINMDVLFNKVYMVWKQRPPGEPIESGVRINSDLSSTGVLYPTTGGEAAHVKGRCLAVDGMPNVIDFLEMLENEKVDGYDFLELRNCYESCAGAILSYRNRFLVTENLRRYASKLPACHKKYKDYKKYCSAEIHMDEIEPRSMIKYDKDIEKALQKMENARKLKELFPGIDCGACGAPSCEALAEDVAKGLSDMNSCVFLRTLYEKRGDISGEEAVRIMERIWGKDKFEKGNKN